MRSRSTRVASVLVALVTVFSATTSLSCKSKSSRAAAADDASPKPSLPPLTIRDDSHDLTFSYILLDGGFRQVKSVADVPYEARDAVRVWSENSGDGIAGPYIYVADLRMKLPDGTYRVDVMERSYFDDLAEDRRKKSKLGTAPPAGGNVDPPGGGGQVKPGTGKLVVIIYGADWCKPCHDAESFLKSKGIPFVHKNIEDPNDNEEMREKLESAGIHSNSIPILDVGGKLLVGYDPGELDRAIAEAQVK